MKTPIGYSGVKVTERKLRRCHAVGRAWADSMAVEVDPRQEPQARLNTVIHEVIHCIFPNMEEEEVDRVATVISDTLWQDRYRRVDV
jgi:hypothetical protein